MIVPTRDTCELTLRCLGAVSAAAPAAGCEVVLVDDGSRDDTGNLVRARFPDVRVLRHDTPQGFTRSANAGLRAATGSLLLLLNSDTEVRADSLRALLDAFEREPTLGIGGAQLLNVDGSAQWSGGRLPTCLWLFAEASGIVRQLARLPGYRRMRPLARAADRDVDWVSGAALAMRRTVWERLGPLDESFRLYGQDLDLCSRTREAAWTIRVLSGVSVVHHQGATVQQTSSTIHRHNAEYLWTDLVRWSAKAHGEGYARRATLALVTGGRLRLFGRRLRAVALTGERHVYWSRQNRELAVAIHALRSATP